MSEHFKAALKAELVQLDSKSLKSYYYVFSSNDVYNEDGERTKEKSCCIYLKQYLKLPNDNSHFILIQNIPDYKLLRRRNFCKILIQTERNSYFELYNTDIFEIRRDSPLCKGYNSYAHKTSKGDFTSTYTTLKFLYALIEILGIDGNSRTYILYKNGNYESIVNEPIINDF